MAARPLFALMTSLLLFIFVSAPTSAWSQDTSIEKTASPTTNTSLGGLSTSKTGTASSFRCPLKPGQQKLRAQKTKSGLLCLAGTIGQWFPMAQGRRLLKDVKLGLNALGQIPLLQQQLTMRLDRIKLLELQVLDSEKISATWRKAAEQQSAALLRKSSWWSSPTLWLAVGLLFGVGSMTAITIAVR